jgi:hypothetical protein
MNKTEVTVIVKSEIEKYVKDVLDKEVAALMHGKGTKTHQELIDIIKDAMEAVYKMLWVKKDFWKSDIR